jgi:hypothetical protein
VRMYSRPMPVVEEKKASADVASRFGFAAK